MSDSNFLVSKASICSGTPRASENALLPRTPPNCARCKNHGLKITLKGHKRYCKYRCCNCEKCRLTSDRQKIMALQTSWRRAQAQDEARALLMGEVPPSVPVNSFLSHHNKLHQTKISPSKYLASEQCKTPHVNTPVIQPSHEGSCDSSSLPSSTSNTASSLLAKKQTLICANSAHMPFGQSAEIFLEYCQKLLEKFRYPWEMMPLMYVILKDAKADIEEASRRIDEAKQFLRLVDYYSHSLAFSPTTFLPFSPIYLGTGLYPSQIYRTGTSQPDTEPPSPRLRSRSLPIIKSKSKTNLLESPWRL